jgi:hypothetical protein
MKFKNPQNGYIEEASIPWLWALVFGIFYFMAKGVWVHVFAIALLGFVLLGSLGPGGIAIMFFVWIGYAFAASEIVRKAYLRKGWNEVGS